MPEVTKSTSKLKNYIALILDKSGSMQSLKNEVVGGFNDQLRAIREQNKQYKMETLLSLVTFSTFADEPTAWLVDVNSINELTPEAYMPDGMTAMYDAVGKTVEALRALPDANSDDVSFLVIVISDGQENNSKLYNTDKIAELVKECEKSGRWTFTYIGANQDLGQISKHLNISIHNTLSFAATSDGYKNMTGSMLAATDNYYRGRSVGLKASKHMFSGVDPLAVNDDAQNAANNSADTK